jgi:UDP-N-acetylmuramate--alanine ligase
MIVINRNRVVHFIGIGGVGMSGLAELLKQLGFTVSGSDRQMSAITKRLESLGIAVQYDHEVNFVKRADIVVYSSAIGANNAEREYAAAKGATLMRRAEMLGEFMRAKFSVGIAGTHGKTTTTSLIGHILSEAGKNPTVIVGGTLKQFGSNAVMGEGELLVAEADEYDRSFLKMFPSIAVVTNIEADHLDCYADIEDIKGAFSRYINGVPFYGAVVACVDEANVREVLTTCSRPVITYGTDASAMYRARGVTFSNNKSRFVLHRDNSALCDVTLTIPGMHNVKNACAACAVALELGVSPAMCAESLSRFSGIKRRFEIVGEKRGVVVIDDYAHHPSEISATLAAARTAGYKHIVAVFQPHLYSRTRDFMDDFARSLSAADEVIVTGIYKSREEPIPGVDAAEIARKITLIGAARATFVEKKEAAMEAAASLLRAGDAVLVMGAGDIGEICKPLLARIDHE